VEKRLMLGNEAIARGAWEAGVRVVSAYPGTPSTEITKYASEYKEMYAEWAVNEKVSAEVAIGACYAGARAMCCMKHVGVNVAADPFFTASYTGVNGGLVIIVADEPAMHSSQNEQDSRYYAKSAHIPMLEPSNAHECKEFVKIAFKMSEEYDTPVFVRLTTRTAHSQGFVNITDREELPLKPYVKDPKKYVMMPLMARGRHIEVEKREIRLEKDVENSPLNTVEFRDKKVGIVCSGAVYQYVKEATNASICKLANVYPIPVGFVKKFASEVSELIVCEELEPFIEETLKVHGIKCHGKEIFGKQGELSVASIRNKLYGITVPNADLTLPQRPPVMCAGCSHRSVFYILKKLKVVVSGDIGCYTMGALPPLEAMDLCLCMGGAITMAHGYDKARSPHTKNMVSVMGDSTFVHSGITGLINAVYNKGISTHLILDNAITGMTGHQENPASGKTIIGEETHLLDLELLCKAIGVKRVQVVDAFDLKAIQTAVKEEMAKDEVSVIIIRRPCALMLKGAKPNGMKINEKCKNCKACMAIGCPAISNNNGKIKINSEQCTACKVCAGLCGFNAIEEIKS